MVKTFEIIHLGKTQLCQGDTRPTKYDILLLAQFYLLRHCAEIEEKKHLFCYWKNWPWPWPVLF